MLPLRAAGARLFTSCKERGAPMLDLTEYPRFSLAERDRRWGRVRELMRERDCACLVAPGLRDPEDQATSRYLSQIGGIGVHAWVVFPLHGDVTAIVESD